MAADTTLTISQIEVGLAEHFGIRNNVIVPKVSWGLLNHEADLLIMNKSGYLTEIEIKRSWSDFLADFRKEHGHADDKISWRFYAVPKSISDKCKTKLEEIDPHKTWGLIEYTDTVEQWGVIRKGFFLNTIYAPSNYNQHNPLKRLDTEEMFKLARLGTMRIWPLKKSITRYQKELSQQYNGSNS